MMTDPNLDTEPKVAPAPEKRLTPYSPDAAVIIKANMKKIWERVRVNRNLNQSSLANALGLSQGAVSKLLGSENSHPWSAGKIKQFAEFCRVPISEIIGDLPLTGFFDGWTGEKAQPNPELVDESLAALDRFYTEHGKVVGRDRLDRLAVIVALRVASTNRSLEDFNRVIMGVILEEAGRNI